MFYRRNLPHWQPAGAEYFITFRLDGSLPKQAILKLKQEQKLLMANVQSSSRSMDSLSALRERIHKNIFKKYEQLLDNSEVGPTWLSKPEIAKIVKEAIHHRDQKEYDLYAYCVMSNHVHLVFKHLSAQVTQDKNEYPVTEIMGSLKKYTARLCNIELSRTGSPFWQAESYDHVIRDSGELERIIYYTLNNPVKAGLVSSWNDWPDSYCKIELRKLF